MASTLLSAEDTKDVQSRLYNFVKEVASRNEQILFVGTKKQAQEAIKEEAIRCGAFYVNERWLGGTNDKLPDHWKSLERLKKFEELKKSDIYKMLSKKRGIKHRQTDREAREEYTGA
jgi:small subunit ribosomal protein S2